MSLVVKQAALMMSVQDGGRWGYLRYGMPESGPMDWWAFRGANLLVGNTPERACLEIGFSSAEMVAEADALMALCGCGFRLHVNNRKMPLWMAFLVRSGDRLRIEKGPGGNWVYLAVKGGFRTNKWMGSRSVYPRGGLGRLIGEGDRLPMAALMTQSRQLSGRAIPISAQPNYGRYPLISVIPGPHQNRFQSASLATFWEDVYSVSPQSDRMGYRLTGPSLVHNAGADLVSQGMILGEIQVPGDGQPIVMMPDHPTAGGYTCIGTVAKVDLPLVAQAQPKETQLRFQPIEVSRAQIRLVEVVDRLDSTLALQEDVWHTL